MKEYFVDANIFLRLLLADQKNQFRQTKGLFQKAQAGKIILWTTEAVILEIIWTLGSFYRLSSKKVRDQVTSLLALKNLEVEKKNFILTALDLFVAKKVDFVDAYNFVLAQKEKKKILSFDKDFDRLGKRGDIKKVVK